MSLDKYDHVLLTLLQLNCQTPLRELAEAVHLSTASVQRRIQKLRDSGYIQSTVAILDPDKLKKVITIFVEVQVEKTDINALRQLKQDFSGSEVQQCYYVTGDADFMLVLLVPHMQRFQELCDQMFHNNANVKWFRTIVALDRVKATLDVL
ncbi:hypothetical protein TUM4637_41770 [Shewanella hafniensis]|uniref:Lrp/AsnC family transcriptional regulator n=1 Tax=Shewanella hafniensis TaxID=365590 RepID=UPI001BC14B3E|nr:Lrp/AsnC family transcriptional regulator [Shewanella hafniensis]MCL1134576.1 Lrp/AsnC family transcriptional regulator [Shewanella hafniensis]GIU39557.1 hypothetical protein TUM4637_41770 [Shewanella hafniensis]